EHDRTSGVLDQRRLRELSAILSSAVCIAKDKDRAYGGRATGILAGWGEVRSRRAKHARTCEIRRNSAAARETRSGPHLHPHGRYVPSRMRARQLLRSLD